MLEEAIPSFLTSLHTWFTPNVLFVLLNLVIGTIAVTSKASGRREEDDDPISAGAATSTDNLSVSSKLYRTSSAVLHRLRSFNLNRAAENMPHPSPATNHAASKPDPAPEDPAACVEEADHHLSRSQSDELQAALEIDTTLAVRMKKSAIQKSVFGHFEESEVLQRTDGGNGDGGGSGEVDARADDFINRFRQQLKLQRLDSIVRHKRCSAASSENIAQK